MPFDLSCLPGCPQKLKSKNVVSIIRSLICQKGMAPNVCVSAVVPYRSRVLSHETKRLNEDKALIQLVTAPLQKHFVGRWPSVHRD